jgi:hypothetical protein
MERFIIRSNIVEKEEELITIIEYLTKVSKNLMTQGY